MKNGSGGHKWLGYNISGTKAGNATFDLNHHLQAISKALVANKIILCDRNVPGKDGLGYYDAVVSPLAVFGSGHGTLNQKALQPSNVAYRKFLPPSNLDWSRPRKEILMIRMARRNESHWNKAKKFGATVR